MINAILIIDDEEHILRSLKRLLRRDGYEIHLADSGPAALEILANTEIAVMICDQRMPGMTGAQVLAEAYKLRPDTVRITLTGHTDLIAAQASINEGHVNQFLLKPWDDDQLRAIVQSSVEAYELVRENRRLEELTRQQKDELEAWNQQLEEKVRQRTEELRTQNENLEELQRRVEQSLRDTVGVLAGMLEVFSPNMGIHCKRVAQLAHQLASQLHIADHDLRDIEFAAHLHDLGKLSNHVVDGKTNTRRSEAGKTPPSVRHTETGYAVLSHVSGFTEAALAVRHQDERFDGNGYPDGLKGNEIPLASRIIAVADAYDNAAFCTKDPLKVSREAGREVLTKGREKQFDPRLVDLLLQYLDNLGANVGTDVEIEVSPEKISEGMILSRPIHNRDGILLLKEGTCLTVSQVEHIHALSDVDPLLAHVFVRCSNQDTSTNEPDDSHDSSDVLPIEPEIPPRADEQTPTRIDPERLDNERSDLGQADSTPATVTSIPRAVASRAMNPPFPKRTEPRSKVLVVDDSVLICNALRRELKSVGIEASATDSGWIALNRVENEHFDAVLVDLMMPAMSGEELVQRLHQCAPTLPCFILTGNATKERVLTLTKKPNVAGILTKPWDHDRLVSVITDAIAKGKPKLTKESV